MFQKGYELESMSFGYKFHSIKPELAVVRIDYRTFKKNEDFIDYKNLFEDSGWKHIVGTKGSRSQYFKKEGTNNDDDIFSDSSSKAGKYKRLTDIRILSVIILLLFTASYSRVGYINVNIIANPRLLYFTPGLWERTGLRFWNGFLFETPFVLLRAIWIVPLIMVICTTCQLVKSRQLYKKQKSSNY